MNGQNFDGDKKVPMKSLLAKYSTPLEKSSPNDIRHLLACQKCASMQRIEMDVLTDFRSHTNANEFSENITL